MARTYRSTQCSIPNRFFHHLLLTLVQLDELYCRVRLKGKMWLWLAIDPATKILPSLHLGKRKNEDAIPDNAGEALALMHDLKLRLHPDSIPAFMPWLFESGHVGLLLLGITTEKQTWDWIHPAWNHFWAPWSDAHTLWTMIRLFLFIRKIRLLYPLDKACPYGQKLTICVVLGPEVEL